MTMQPGANQDELRVANLPGLIFFSTALLLVAGVASAAAWWWTGNPVWIRSFFSYAGAVFFIACSALGVWLSIRCWRQFEKGDLLRPAWLLIAAAAISQLIGGLFSQVFGLESWLNPLSWFQQAIAQPLAGRALELGRVFGPVYLIFLACGLAYVLRAYRRNGIVGRLRMVDALLLGIVIVYTIDFFVTVVFSPGHRGSAFTVGTVIGWSSDPLLCVLLFQAMVIRRSIGNMGWGLISRCWLSFTAAIFLTSVGDIGLWASAREYIPYGLEMASWYVWFLASAAYALGPAYQLQAILRATGGHIREQAAELVQPALR
ncbi:MAG: hypothetical protein ACRD4P_04730 [Bryobacteraceae bacterium]